MTNPPASTEGSTPSPAAPSTPSPASTAFADNSTPEWVKSAGLQDAHDKGTPTAQTPAATPTPTAVPVAATPATPIPVATTPAPLAIDHRALAQAIREGNTPAPVGPSDEEVSRQLGIVTVTPAMYKSTFGVDGTPEQIAGLNDYGQGIAKQAVTIAKVLFDRELQQIREQIQPHMEVIQRQERDRIKNEFFAEHKDLAGYEAHVTQQFLLAQQSGRKFNTLKEASAFVAEQSRSSLKALGITPVAATPTNGSQPLAGKPASQARTMTPTSVGGKGGGASPATQPKTAGQQVWDS